jgi:hypothetical protein
MPLYEKDPPGVGQIVNDLVEKFHGGLRDAGVSIDLLFAKAKADEFGETDAVALKDGGYQVAAKVKINGYKARVQGHADAEITIDGDRWDTWSEAEQRAILDHQIEHLELKTDRDNNILRDDLDRPKLLMRRHDHQFGWFDSIVRRHGDASIESQQLAAFTEKRRQLWLPFETEADAIGEARNNKRPAPKVEEADEQMTLGEQSKEDVGAQDEQQALGRQVGKALRGAGLRAPKGKRGPAKRKMANV